MTDSELKAKVAYWKNEECKRRHEMGIFQEAVTPLRKAAEHFIGKVDSGKARSVESYKQFKDAIVALDATPAQGDATYHCPYSGDCLGSFCSAMTCKLGHKILSEPEHATPYVGIDPAALRKETDDFYAGELTRTRINRFIEKLYALIAAAGDPVPVRNQQYEMTCPHCSNEITFFYEASCSSWGVMVTIGCDQVPMVPVELKYLRQAWDWAKRQIKHVYDDFSNDNSRHVKRMCDAYDYEINKPHRPAPPAAKPATCRQCGALLPEDTLVTYCKKCKPGDPPAAKPDATEPEYRCAYCGYESSNHKEFVQMDRQLYCKDAPCFASSCNGPCPDCTPAPPTTEPPLGLYNKFTVIRNDGRSAPGEKHHDCEYFVLDLTHDKYAPEAIRVYAQACIREYPELAADLREKYESADTPAPPTTLEQRIGQWLEDIKLEGDYKEYGPVRWKDLLYIVERWWLERRPAPADGKERDPDAP